MLLIGFVATATTTMQQTKPINDMAIAARKFAQGNFDARVHDTDGFLKDGENAVSPDAL